MSSVDEKVDFNIVPALYAEILDRHPARISRPLCLVEGRAYAASWPSIAEKGQVPRSCFVLVREDGALFSDGAITGASPLSDLEPLVSLREPPPADIAWSGAGVLKYLAGERPDPARVFDRLRLVSDFFIDFDRSLADQSTMTEFSACWILATYFLDALSVVGYIWPNGERGSGKSHLLRVVAGCSYLGQVILSSGSFASLRDLADYGATLAFDDCENIADRGFDPDKRAILLAGNSKGALVPLKEPTNAKGWVTRYVHAFCPRLFSAIRLPDPVLASRTIVVPLVRSVDESKTRREPADFESWPFDRRELVDDLWAIGLSCLSLLPKYDRTAADKSTLRGRNLEPWRGVLAVALFLQQRHGVSGLYDRMHALSLAYQGERADFEASDRTRLLIRSVWEMLRQRDGEWTSGGMTFRTKRLTDRINDLAVEDELDRGTGQEFANVKQVGWDLKRLRFEKAGAGEGGKRWRVTEAFVESLASAHSVPLQGLPGNE